MIPDPSRWGLWVSTITTSLRGGRWSKSRDKAATSRPTAGVGNCWRGPGPRPPRHSDSTWPERPWREQWQHSGCGIQLTAQTGSGPRVHPTQGWRDCWAHWILTPWSWEGRITHSAFQADPYIFTPVFLAVKIISNIHYLLTNPLILSKDKSSWSLIITTSGVLTFD